MRGGERERGVDGVFSHYSFSQDWPLDPESHYSSIFLQVCDKLGSQLNLSHMVVSSRFRLFECYV